METLWNKDETGLTTVQNPHKMTRRAARLTIRKRRKIGLSKAISFNPLNVKTSSQNLSKMHTRDYDHVVIVFGNKTKRYSIPTKLLPQKA